MPISEEAVSKEYLLQENVQTEVKECASKDSLNNSEVDAFEGLTAEMFGIPSSSNEVNFMALFLSFSVQYNGRAFSNSRNEFYTLFLEFLFYLNLTFF